ncbi:MAG: hypothetical protein JWM16_5900 [Verrucomicrobiales bacterium]|nr:hypothetical protein [Verrucomicrobiales bacterium]
MPISDFHGSTFVAFTDIAGFKAMMSDDNRAPAALDALYASGYHVISNQIGSMHSATGSWPASGKTKTPSLIYA